MKKYYESILAELPYLLQDNKYDVTVLSNASALLNTYMPDLNWVGFYLFRDNQLILGPFQGKVACTVIPLTKGVCGMCGTIKETVVVENVHEFKGHIACDSASNSEICVPIFKGNEFYGLLDIDSPIFSRFDDEDKKNLEQAVKIIEAALLFSKE